MTGRSSKIAFALPTSKVLGKSSKGMWQMSHPSGPGVASLALQDSPPFQPFLRPSPSSGRTSPVLQLRAAKFNLTNTAEKLWASPADNGAHHKRMSWQFCFLWYNETYLNKILIKTGSRGLDSQQGKLKTACNMQLNYRFLPFSF